MARQAHHANGSPQRPAEETILKGLTDLLTSFADADRGPGAMNILTIRKHKRFAVRRKANLVGAGGRPMPGLLIELSLEGCRMGFASSAKLAIGQQVKVRIGGFDDFRAEVRWAGN